MLCSITLGLMRWYPIIFLQFFLVYWSKNIVKWYSTCNLNFSSCIYKLCSLFIAGRVEFVWLRPAKNSSVCLSRCWWQIQRIYYYAARHKLLFYISHNVKQMDAKPSTIVTEQIHATLTLCSPWSWKNSIFSLLTPCAYTHSKNKPPSLASTVNVDVFVR